MAVPAINYIYYGFSTLSIISCNLLFEEYIYIYIKKVNLKKNGNVVRQQDLRKGATSVPTRITLYLNQWKK